MFLYLAGGFSVDRHYWIKLQGVDCFICVACSHSVWLENTTPCLYSWQSGESSFILEYTVVWYSRLDAMIWGIFLVCRCILDTWRTLSRIRLPWRKKKKADVGFIWQFLCSLSLRYPLSCHLPIPNPSTSPASSSRGGVGKGWHGAGWRPGETVRGSRRGEECKIVLYRWAWLIVTL